MSESTPKTRGEQVIRLLNDPVAELTPSEARKLVWHFAMYEIHQLRVDLIQRRKRRHGTYIADLMEIANFKHELQDL